MPCGRQETHYLSYYCASWNVDQQLAGTESHSWVLNPSILMWGHRYLSYQAKRLLLFLSLFSLTKFIYFKGKVAERASIHIFTSQMATTSRVGVRAKARNSLVIGRVPALRTSSNTFPGADAGSWIRSEVPRTQISAHPGSWHYSWWWLNSYFPLHI